MHVSIDSVIKRQTFLYSHQMCSAYDFINSQFSAAASEKFDLVVIGGGSGGLACSKEGQIVPVLLMLHYKYLCLSTLNIPYQIFGVSF